VIINKTLPKLNVYFKAILILLLFIILSFCIFALIKLFDLKVNPIVLENTLQITSILLALLIIKKRKIISFSMKRNHFKNYLNYFFQVIILVILLFFFDTCFHSFLIKVSLLLPPKDYIFSFGSLLHIVFLAPIKEELIFRGILLKEETLKNINRIFYILFASILFALYHFIFDINLFGLFIFSVVVSFLYVFNRSIIQVILFHIIINILAYFNVSSFFHEKLENQNPYISFLFIIPIIVLLIFVFKKIVINRVS